MSQNEQPTDPANGEVTYEDTELRQLAAFVGPNEARYYLARWAPLLRNRTGSTGFNWAAFFLSGLWLPYRKMYKVTVIFYAVTIGVSIFETVLFAGVMGKPATLLASYAVRLAAGLICGAYGNRWYLSHARAEIAQHNREGFPEDASLKMLSKRGGTSRTAALGMSVLFVVLSYTVSFATVALLSVLGIRA